MCAQRGLGVNECAQFAQSGIPTSISFYLVQHSSRLSSGVLSEGGTTAINVSTERVRPSFVMWTESTHAERGVPGAAVFFLNWPMSFREPLSVRLLIMILVSIVRYHRLHITLVRQGERFCALSMVIFGGGNP